MEVFIQVMESGNFTRAAAALGLPRSTVSTIIQGLEDRLGAQLLRRSTRAMVPTDEGHAFLRMAREIVDSVNDSEQAFRHRPAQLRGRLRVDMPSRIGRRIVIPALPSLLDRHSDLDVEISTTDRQVDLVAEGIDCLVRVGELRDTDLICRKLGDLALVNCVGAAYVERYGMPRALGDLPDHHLVRYGLGEMRGPLDFEHRVDGKDAFVPMRSRIAVDNAESYIAAALTGMGMIQVPRFDVRDHLTAGTLVPVLDNHHPAPMPLSLLYAKRRNVPTRIIVFQDWISEMLKTEGVFDIG